MSTPAHYDLPADEVYQFPASFTQQRLWFLDQLVPGNPAYNITRPMRLVGALDEAALGRALDALVRRHESLRTTFTVVDGQPMQVIAPALALPLPVADLRHLPAEEREAAAFRLNRAEARRPFDLARGPLLRARLLRLGPREHVLLLTIHHIVADEWSMGVLVGDLAALYNAQRDGTPAALAELPIQYADYAEWQRARLQGAALEEELGYWTRQLAGAPAVLELPTDRPRPPVQHFCGATCRFVLPPDLHRALKWLSQREGATLFMTLLAGFQVLLQRYSGQDDIVVGSPIAGRTRTELEGLIGFFVNTLVLRADLSGDPPFREALGRVREMTLGAYAHQELPFERLVEELQPRRHLSYNPLFQVMVVLQNVPSSSEEFAGLTVEFPRWDAEAAKLDMTLFIAETEEGLSGAWEYSTDLFEASTIERMIGHFRTLLEGIVADPGRRLSQLPLLGEAERRQLLVEWNDTAAPYPHEARIHELFEAQAERTPDAVAAVFGTEQLTYAELNRRANQLARYLQKLGVGPDVLVGICMERSIGMVVGLLGILKAGGAYLPLDPTYPSARLAFMLEDARVAVLLTQGRLAQRLPQPAAPLILLDAEWEAIAHASTENTASDTGAEDLAYVIYTSGSTGQPKGVLGLHRGAINRFHWMWQTFPFQPDERCCQKTSLSFVDAVWEVFGPLLQGIPLVIIPDEIVKDAQRLTQYLAETRVTRIVLVPSLLRVLLDTGPDLQARLPRLRFWVTSGEALPLDLMRRFHERLPQSKLVNLYGSSEVAADATWYDTVEGEERTCVPIGRPIANTRIYLLDRQLQPVPIGVPGEVYVGGAGLARGYLRRPELTAQRFIRDPFGATAEERLYKTGDRARYLPDGNIEYLGRLDHQVKVRGYRIELGEIEAILRQHAAVQDTVVIVRKDPPGDQRLVAYVVPRAGTSAGVAELRGYLKEHLPEYMVPAAFVLLEALPLTPNGKVDRQALPLPDQSALGTEEDFVAPRTRDEERLAEIWAAVLGIERIGVHDNFFEIGGHSLSATQVVSRIRDALQVEVPLRGMFETPTIATLAALVAQMQARSSESEAIPLRPIARSTRRA